MSEKELIQAVYDAAYEVRRHLAPGFLESVYKKALQIELISRGLKAEKEQKLEVKYKGCIIGEFYADILAEDLIIIEVKAVNILSPAHELQLLNYLTITGLNTGFLINYGGEHYSIRQKSRICPDKLKK